MIVEIVDIVPSIEAEKRDGGTYDAFLINYTNAKGAGEITKPAGVIKKNKELYAKLLALSAGDKVELVFEKQGMYSNLVDVKSLSDASALPTAAPATKLAPAVKSSFVDNSIGMQVGNALNNAAVLLAHKVVKGTIESVAEDILRVGERLKINLVSGKYAKSEEKAIVIEEDIDFTDD